MIKILQGYGLEHFARFLRVNPGAQAPQAAPRSQQGLDEVFLSQRSRTRFTHVQVATLRVASNEASAVYEAVQAVRVETTTETVRAAPEATASGGARTRPLQPAQRDIVIDDPDDGDDGVEIDDDADTVVAELRPGGQGAPAENNTAVTALVDRMRASMFASVGDDAYDERLDLNSDGRINLADLAQAARKTAPSGTPVTDGNGDVSQYWTPDDDDNDEAANLARLREAMFSVAGDEHYNEAADLDGDGRVNLRDLAALRDD